MTNVQHKQLILAALLFVCDVLWWRESVCLEGLRLCTMDKVIEEDKVSECAQEHNAVIEIVSLVAAIAHTRTSEEHKDTVTAV